jgi:imidazolonepropionase-like amidohydrolase
MCAMVSRRAMIPILCAVLCLPATAPAQQSTRAVVLRGARVIDGTGGRPLENAVIVIREGHIAACGPASATPAPVGAKIIDYRGKTIIPGLISDHSHVGVVDGLSVGGNNYNRENVLGQLRQYEAYGVTTVLALGLNGPPFLEIRQTLHEGEALGADLFGADRGIGIPDGAPPGKALPVGSDQLYRVTTADEARAAVREMAGRRADVIKLWLDDFSGALPTKMSPEIYTAAIDESHRAGLRVAVHIHDLDDAEAVLAAGADIIAHGVRDRPVNAAFIEQMKARGAWYIPTLALDEATFVYADDPPWTHTAFFKNGLGPALRAQLESNAWRVQTRAAPESAAARKSLEMNMRNLKTLYDAGVKIGFGTDSGASPLRIPGIAEHRELALLVRAGLTPLQAITLATSKAAELLQLTDRGTLMQGTWADLVVLDADPSVDIAATDKIAAVWHRGRRIDAGE